MAYIKILLLTLIPFSLCLAADILKDNQTGLAFPTEITLDEGGHAYTLKATGVATRKKFGVKVYSVVHYIEPDAHAAETPPTDKFEALLNNNKPKQMTMKWIHSASAKQMQEGYRESFKNALSPEQLAQLQEPIDRYLTFFKAPINKGDVMVLRWLPEGKIELFLNQQLLGSLTHAPFAKALWSLWFGPQSVVDRNQLFESS